ncbi:carboxylesterase 1-like [Phragmites australis]|uniref:carboxylesterase 1-like n=1 Tax=Phragmites australis TaxID=29695 RepID=UPI002D79D242|nr:carboxylesterase 1-like [Phragmites australis]
MTFNCEYKEKGYSRIRCISYNQINTSRFPSEKKRRDMDASTDAAAAALRPPMTKSTSFFMDIVVNPDGTVTRPDIPLVPPSATGPAVSRDVPLDASRGTYLRLYLPNPVPPSPAKLPVVLYFHGGGFVILSAATVFYHGYCEAMAAAVPAIVASLEYRLAPVHRLPAAYDDAAAAVRWLRDAAPEDPWVAAHGDLSRCFVMGSSSGGNMAFFAGVRTKGLDLSPAAVQGLLLHQPYLGGVERTPSEAKSEDDSMLPLEANDKLWSLALPVGADRDHEFCNPAKALPPDAVSGLPRCLVTGNDADPLIDRQREFIGWLQERGVEVVAKTDFAGYHAAELFVPEKAKELCATVREFVFANDA